MDLKIKYLKNEDGNTVLFLKCIDIFGVCMYHCNECLWYRKNNRIDKGFCLFYGMGRKDSSNICIDFRNGDDGNFE